MKLSVIVVKDQYLVGVGTCTLAVTRDQTPTPSQNLVPPTTSHMVTFTEEPTQNPCLAGVSGSLHQKWKYFA